MEYYYRFTVPKKKDGALKKRKGGGGGGGDQKKIKDKSGFVRAYITLPLILILKNTFLFRIFGDQWK